MPTKGLVIFSSFKSFNSAELVVACNPGSLLFRRRSLLDNMVLELCYEFLDDDVLTVIPTLVISSQ
jgi:hypothetical protein